MKRLLFQHNMTDKFGSRPTHVERDDDARRVVGGQLDGGAEETVEEDVLRREPGSWAEEGVRFRKQHPGVSETSQRRPSAAAAAVPAAAGDRSGKRKEKRSAMRPPGSARNHGSEEKLKGAAGQLTGGLVEREADAPTVAEEREVGAAEDLGVPLVEGERAHAVERRWRPGLAAAGAQREQDHGERERWQRQGRRGAGRHLSPTHSRSLRSGPALCCPCASDGLLSPVRPETVGSGFIASPIATDGPLPRISAFP
jgi:hypothetical protein